MKVISLENLKTFYNNSKKSFGNMTNITYAELKTLRDNSQLVEGQYYRITDFVTTVDQEDAKSAGHLFDIIVLATSSNTLNENALAVKHAEDTYFNNSNLDAWELKYDLDNDKSKYAWADETNGKGVIYYMKDEFNNECPYDFKNVLFKRYKLKNKLGLHLADYPLGNSSYKNPINQTFTTLQSILGNSMNSDNISFYYTRGVYSDGYLVSGADIYTYNSNYMFYDEKRLVFNRSSGGSYVGLCRVFDSFDIIAEVEDTNGEWFYTFSKKTTATDAAMDASLSKLTNIECYSNSIKEHIKSTLYYLNNNIFIVLGNTGQMYSNNFNIDCYYNTFGNECNGNTFGICCQNNTFRNNCSRNTFGDNYNRNTFGNSCQDNTFGNSCDSNTFGNYCYHNTFRGKCNSNTFGNDYSGNTFGGKCSGNTFGNNCNNNKFGNECSGNTFGNNCSSNTFEDRCGGNTFGNDYNRNTFGSSCGGNTFGNNCSSNTFGGKCNNNKFGNECSGNTFGDNYSINTFKDRCGGNTFGIDCRNNTFGDSCQGNTFGNGCNSNTFGHGFQNNKFGCNCGDNTFGNGCSSNTFGNGCSSNTFGYSCYSNTFGNSCYSNTFGSNCSTNTFGYSCDRNTFGSSCSSNTFGNSCDRNTFGDNYNYNTFELDTSEVSFELYTTGSSMKIQYLTIYKVSSTTIPANLITLNANYSQVLGLNSSGELVCKPVLD